MTPIQRTPRRTALFWRRQTSVPSDAPGTAPREHLSRDAV